MYLPDNFLGNEQITVVRFDIRHAQNYQQQKNFCLA